MPLLTEYRILLPLTIEEYNIGRRYAEAEATLAETGGGEGVEIVDNRAFADYPLLGGRFTSGQYTEKLYHLNSKVPSYARAILPRGSLVCREQSWNCFPYIKTVLTNPDYMKNGMEICVESMHLPDKGNTNNPLLLSDEDIKLRKIVHLNIASKSELKPEDIIRKYDPTLFRSTATGRGPLKPKQIIYGLKPGRIEELLEGCPLGMGPKCRQTLASTPNLNRETFCLLDDWVDMDTDDLLEHEAKVRAQLDVLRSRGVVKGMKHK